jgi:hypothetical protein
VTYTPIPHGAPDWDVPVNSAFSDQDARIDTNAGNISTISLQVTTNTANIATNTTDIAARLVKANNLSDLLSASTARTNLGLGGAAVLNVGTTAGTVAAGDDSRITGAVPKSTIVVNVKDFGALGNNTGDDAPFINSAVTQLGAAGGILYFPPGDYRLGSSTVINLPAAITVQGAGPGATTIRLSSAFSGSSGITVSSDDCVIRDIQIRGGSTTTTSNPVANGVTATGVQSFRVLNSTFQYINGYAIKALGTAGVTLHGGMVDNVKIQSCAGGVWVKSDTTNTAANFVISNLFTRFTGVNSGGSANLDCLRIEDSWDVLVQNAITWMNATVGGTGTALRVRGDCAATFIQNLDALGPQTGAANVVIEGNGTTSPQNVQIQGGVIQQGTVGILISDATNQVRVRNMRIINNQTHGASVTSTGFGIYFDECLFSLNGAGAAGTNYDINWSGAATGYATDNRFGTAITSVGVAGVQFTANVAAGQNVRFLNCDFAGTASASTNWFTNLPQVVTRQDGTNMEFIGSLDYRLGTGRVQYAPSLSTGTAMSVNVAGTDAFDRFRLLGSGSQQFGTGAGARDTTWGRQGTAQIGTSDSDVIVGLAGKTVKVQSGSNAKSGTVVANGTTAVTVTTTAITANSVVVFGLKTQAGTAATEAPFMSAVTAGTSFQIKSSAGDTSTYNYVIFDLI